jgi:type IV fimbrial biogenesis protein FimT
MGNDVRSGLHRLGGLTLLECLITLGIVAILMGIGVPAYRDQLAAARARAGAHQLYAAMQYARSMAQAHGTVVTLCPVIDPSSHPPQCAGHFGQSLIAIKHSGEDSQLLRVWPPVAGVTVTNRTGSNWVTGALRWNPQGVGRRNLTLSVCAQGHNWSVITNRLGRPRLARDWGVCPPVA